MDASEAMRRLAEEVGRGVAGSRAAFLQTLTRELGGKWVGLQVTTAPDTGDVSISLSCLWCSTEYLGTLVNRTVQRPSFRFSLEFVGNIPLVPFTQQIPPGNTEWPKKEIGTFFLSHDMLYSAVNLVIVTGIYLKRGRKNSPATWYEIPLPWRTVNRDVLKKHCAYPSHEKCRLISPNQPCNTKGGRITITAWSDSARRSFCKL